MRNRILVSIFYGQQQIFDLEWLKKYVAGLICYLYIMLLKIIDSPILLTSHSNTYHSMLTMNNPASGANHLQKKKSFYIICVLLGCSVGYWAIFVTTVTNFVRGALIPISLLFQYLKTVFSGSMISAAAVVACCCLLLALIALNSMQETFFKDLNYQEE